MNYQEKTCADCAHCIEICCDYGVCDIEAEDIEDGASHIDVIDWVAYNLKDMQQDTCQRFERA